MKALSALSALIPTSRRLQRVAFSVLGGWVVSLRVLPVLLVLLLLRLNCSLGGEWAVVLGEATICVLFRGPSVLRSVVRRVLATLESCWSVLILRCL